MYLIRRFEEHLLSLSQRGLLKSAVCCDDPVIFLEHRPLYARTGTIVVEEEMIPETRADRMEERA
jgi:pyruvate/2-oxoglutarate/acetoin dehydrogenase E1 component